MLCFDCSMWRCIKQDPLGLPAGRAGQIVAYMTATRFILVGLILLWPFAVSARDLVVFAAASLKEPMDEIAAAFGDVTVSYAGSGTLARQITFGAPADVVVLAHPRWMDVLDDAELLRDRGALAGNTLVLVSTTRSDVALTSAAIKQALGDGRLAIGLVEAVPAGIYGKAALENLGLWSVVSSQLAQVDNVRAVLALVARAEVPLGVVYATDAAVSAKVHIVAEFPKDSYPNISYEFGIVAHSDHPRTADFADYLRSPAAASVFGDAGFLAPEGSQ